MPWTAATPPAFGEFTGVPDPYPYDNLVYLAASAEDEVAWDIPKEVLKEKPTIDGLPHGALTDAMLRGLEGAANTDGDDELTVLELGRYVTRFVEGRFEQTPQLLHPPGEIDAVNRPMFGVVRAAVPSAVSPAPVTLRVRLGGRGGRSSRAVGVDRWGDVLDGRLRSDRRIRPGGRRHSVCSPLDTAATTSWRPS